MHETLIIPDKYKPILDLKETEIGIKRVKDFFELNLSSELQLRRVSAPLFVLSGTGINDDLNGIEKPVSFVIKDLNEKAEIVQSLAKWKRIALADYKIETGYGIYTDMNAIRPDEALSNFHSIYVDQWDWERVLTAKDRNLEFLKNIVRRIYSIFKRMEYYISENFSGIHPTLPDEIKFIHAEELLDMYPNLQPKERESKITEKYKAVFVIGIGGELKDGTIHDGRAPDYDDWSTDTEKGYKGLNGDIILWNPVLNCAFELSSMGIRVDREALMRQLSIRHAEERKKLLFHKRLLNDELPLSIGGGIGQSRLCMFFLRKAHIGEVQSSIWPQQIIEKCRQNNIVFI